MKSAETNRRNFLKKMAYASAGTLVLPTILSSCSKRANDRIHMAHIGVGSRGGGTTKSYFLPVPDSRSLATCDVFTDRREGLANHISAYYKEQYDEQIVCTPYLDFEEVLDRKDIDAVHIATADHWHLPIAIKAARAGKHIYLEKPLGLSLDSMIELERIINEKRLVFHYGAQQRSLDHTRKGIEMVKSGKIGDIEKIDIWAPPGGNVQPKGSVVSEEPPSNLNYDRWLGPAPVKPYSEARVANIGVWHIYDYALGFIAGWGAHPLDTAVWGAKEQMTGTATFTGQGTFFPEDHFFDTINLWNIKITYENGLKVNFVSNNYSDELEQKASWHDGTTFYGTKGWISLGRGSAASNIPELHDELTKTEIFGENNLHGYNFIQTIKGEMEPFNAIDDAILSDCISHMGNILIRSGKDKIVWDAINRKIVNYPELEKEFFHRELRKPYTI